MRQLTAHFIAWFLALGLLTATTPALAQEVISLEGIEDDEVIDINKTAPAKKQRVIKTGLTGSGSATIEIDEGASSAKPKPDAQGATAAGQDAQATEDAQGGVEAGTEVAQSAAAKPQAAPKAQIIDTDDMAQGDGEGGEAQEQEAPAKKKKAERKKRKR